MRYLDELLRTPAILALAAQGGSVSLPALAPSLLFCGCGTSYYLAGQLAKLCRAAGRQASAVDAVELLEPDWCREGEPVAVFISRSGRSMETVLAMEKASRLGLASFYVGCEADSPLARGCNGADIIPFACETLILESFSFPAQLLRAALCCGLSCDTAALEGLAQRALASAEEIAAGLDAARLKRMICLGAPFYLPLLREAMLKNGELTLLPAELWGVLEFRHGPRSWADAGCLVSIVPGRHTARYDRAVAEELVGYGAQVLWLGSTPLPGAVHLPPPAALGSVEESIWMNLVLTGLAAHLGEVLGVDASRPKNLLQAVEVL